MHKENLVKKKFPTTLIYVPPCTTVIFIGNYFNSLLTEPLAPTARPPAGGSLRSPTPPAARYARPQRGILKKIEEILPKKNC